MEKDTIFAVILISLLTTVASTGILFYLLTGENYCLALLFSFVIVLLSFAVLANAIIGYIIKD